MQYFEPRGTLYCLDRATGRRVWAFDDFATGDECAHLLAAGASAERFAAAGVTTKHDDTGFSVTG